MIHSLIISVLLLLTGVSVPLLPLHLFQESIIVSSTAITPVTSNARVTSLPVEVYYNIPCLCVNVSVQVSLLVPPLRSPLASQVQG